ncbi:tRNA1(Val) (adenine(37)-N6)-methyltransferase [Shivajiella indica]|uniref:tRNA1(Val) (adenine(37)-N6)-methyltransferase n=1 Tax=Shivajiella indica TaxID=872115 RepID=A0ABW5B953_9BACT
MSKSSKAYFQFKQFGVHQDRCAMKVSTDGVILGAYSGLGNPNNILEIGTGTGVVSLMLAQRFPQAQVTGLEIDYDAWVQASFNADKSPWGNRIIFKNQSFQDFYQNENQKFDFIISNPPYYPDHLKSNNQQRNLALHNDSLTFSDLVEGTSKLLSKEGDFWVILPFNQMKSLELEAMKVGLIPNHILIVRDNPIKPILRVVRSFSFAGKEPFSNELFIKDSQNKYSATYADLLKDFLLIF